MAATAGATARASSNQSGPAGSTGNHERFSSPAAGTDSFGQAGRSLDAKQEPFVRLHQLRLFWRSTGQVCEPTAVIPVQWGDVATWTTAVVAAVTLIPAYRIYRETQSREIRAQARRVHVSFIPESGSARLLEVDPPGFSPHFYRVKARNKSDAPIYDVAIDLFSPLQYRAFHEDSFERVVEPGQEVEQVLAILLKEAPMAHGERPRASVTFRRCGRLPLATLEQRRARATCESATRQGLEEGHSCAALDVVETAKAPSSPKLGEGTKGRRHDADGRQGEDCRGCAARRPLSLSWPHN